MPIGNYTTPIPDDVSNFDELFSCEAIHHSEFSNPFLVNAFSRIPILGKVPNMSEISDLPKQFDLLNRHVDIEKISSAMT